MKRSERRKWVWRATACALCLSIAVWLFSIAFLVGYHATTFDCVVRKGTIGVSWGSDFHRHVEYHVAIQADTRGHHPNQVFQLLHDTTYDEGQVRGDWALAVIRPSILLNRAFWRGDWLGFSLPTYASMRDDEDGPYEVKTTGTAHWLIIPFPWLVLVVATACSYMAHQRRRLRGTVCQECAYDLTGNKSGVCPECGAKIRSAGTGATAATPTN
jgi:hypothetical protein